MMNFRLKLRQPKQLVVPKGPDFRRARTFRSDVDGTYISFKAPRHSPRRSNHLPRLPDHHYRSARYSDGTLPFCSMYSDHKAEAGLKDHFEKLQFFYHAWAFCGPWFSGTVAELNLSFDFIKAVNFPSSMSLFHPRAMEQFIGEYLTFMYSHHLSVTRGYIQEFDAPVNWQPLRHLPVNAVKMEATPRDFSAHRTISHLMFFPIADNVMAKLHFMPSRILGLPRSELDKRVSIEPMLDLMDNIISSIQLELSPEAKAQKVRALAGLDNTNLVKGFPPLKWDNATLEEERRYLNSGAA
ncbi:hypothetical protein [Marinimicrobium sp. C2-29]|uniref:hypothetical protein n=1 Tax=Marinimicrobium sp. C2-29 TaxID=3139825 RepID=UPI00313A0DED